MTFELKVNRGSVMTIQIEIQTVRRRNLRRLIAELKREGVSSRYRLAILELDEEQFDAICAGEPIDDKRARQLEWAMHRPAGWLDRHNADILA